MSLFRRPKKPMQRRVFGANSDDDIDGNNGDVGLAKGDDDSMDVDAAPSFKERRSEKKPLRDVDKPKKNSLLSFDDDDEEGEIFQVKKSSHSKKVMKMLDKERRKKKSSSREVDGAVDIDATGPSLTARYGDSFGISHRSDRHNDNDRNSYGRSNASANELNAKNVNIDPSDPFYKNRSKNNTYSDSSIHTEIRTDDFVLVVKQSEQKASDSKLILNGRAALCAGRDDMSSEDEDQEAIHRFAKPDHFKTLLESGAIPDAAMIHEARKKRQKAREQGDFIELEEKKAVNNKKGRLVREDGDDDDQSDDEERVDMAAITGAKEREERREKFYSVQQEFSGDESDPDMNEWENQQIRKGVTGAQLVSAQQESAIYSQYLIKPSESIPMSTADLLEQAYARSSLEKPRQILLATQKTEQKASGPQKPDEILAKMTKQLTSVSDLNDKHEKEIDEIGRKLKLCKLDELKYSQDAPLAASKFRFYQELRGYVLDLVECLDEKVPKIVDLERKALSCISKQANMLIERRRQDVRDQAKEITQAGKQNNNSVKGKLSEEEDRIRRAAEREGRRTRRRRDRERIEIKNAHLDGMSSDDEIHDQEAAAFKGQLKIIELDASNVFDDVTDDFSQIYNILNKFQEWRQYDMTSYKDTYVSLCIPKILGPLVRLNLVTWNPLVENSDDFEHMDWYDTTIKFAFDPEETEESLNNDPDIRMIPVLVEKIILPKLTELIEMCWDPLSTTQTLKLVGLVRRLERDYPSMHPSSKYTKTLFIGILDKMKNAMDNDVFIPIFPKQHQEGKSSFFQRQFSSALKLLRNILSWQGILSDIALRDIAISSLLNRYLLSALRVCTVIDAISKTYIIVTTIPRIWLQSGSKILESLQPFRAFLENLSLQLDKRNLDHSESYDIVNQMLSKLRTTTT